MRPMRWSLVLVSALIGLGCDRDEEAQPPVTSTTTTTLASPTATAGAVETTSAGELAEALGCVERRTSEDPRTGEPHPPLVAIDCRIREMQLGLATYESPQQRDAVLDYLNEFSGYRTVGNTWIIAVDTREAACVAKERLGGSVVALEGRREPDPYRPAPVTC